MPGQAVRCQPASDSGSVVPRPRQLTQHAGFAALDAAASALWADEMPSGALLLLNDTFRHICAGTVARTLAQACIHPLDTAKTRLQVASPAPLLKTWRHKAHTRALELHMGRLHLHADNLMAQGPRDIYLGLSGAVLGTVPTALLYFSMYEWCKGRLEASKRLPTSMCHVVSASAGAVVSTFVRVPGDTVKHRVQAYLHPNVFQAASHIMKTEGPRGLYHGLLPTLLRDVPEISVQFALYERLRRAVQRQRGVSKLRTGEHLILGSISGACAAAATMPLDLIKTRMQVAEGTPSIRALLQGTLQERGPAGLFAGMGPRVAQAALMSALFFCMFETAKAQLKPQALRKQDDQLLQPKMWRKRRPHVWKRQFVLQ